MDAAADLRHRLQRVWEKNPTSTVFARLADVCLAAGDAGQALAICRRGLRYRPSYANGHLILARCLIAEGELDGAVEALEKVLRLDPDHPGAMRVLADVERGRGSTEVGSTWMRSVVGVDPIGSEPIRWPRAEPEVVASAASVADGDIEKDDSPLVSVTLARLYADQGHRQEAIDLLETLLVRDPDDTAATDLRSELEATPITFQAWSN